jgi:oligopeptide/dipeptide ABC transporter ATP-binding protein
MSELLSIKDLTVEFETDEGIIKAIEGLSLSIKSGETLGLVGESGCGKSVTALSIMRLIQQPAGKIKSGQIIFLGEDLLKISEARMRTLRGNRISMIFQEPMTSLNPVFTIGDQISESIRLHQGLNKLDALDKSIAMLKLVGISSPEERVFNYPHQLSGGMRQRVMIAMALSCEPALLIADEPTTALDVTIQAQIIDLMKSLQADFKMAIMLITHDLGVVAQTCERIAVMYAGQIVEEAHVLDAFKTPRHPYTLGLLRSVPGYNLGEEPIIGIDGKPRLRTIPGMVPNLLDVGRGCRFQDRCFSAQERCSKHAVDLVHSKNRSSYRCLFPNDEAVLHNTPKPKNLVFGHSLDKEVLNG